MAYITDKQAVIHLSEPVVPRLLCGRVLLFWKLAV